MRQLSVAIYILGIGVPDECGAENISEERMIENFPNFAKYSKTTALRSSVNSKHRK